MLAKKGYEEREGRLLIIAKEGTGVNTGILVATNSDGKGGTVHFLGNSCGFVEEGLIDVSGDLGGGVVLMGGAYREKNPAILNAIFTGVGRKGLIKANALQNGDGGRVIL